MRSSSPTTMPSIERVVDRVLLASPSRAGCGPSVAVAVDVVDRVRRRGARRRRGSRLRRRWGAAAARHPAPNLSLSWSSVRENDARSRSSLFTKIARGTSALVGHPPHELGLHLDALDRGHDEHREVGGAQRGGDVARRSRRSPGVSITLTLWPSCSNGASASDTEMRRRCLLGVEVGGGVAVLDPAEPGDRPGGEEQRLGEGGLARPAVADEGHVADLLRRERLRRERLGRHRHPQVLRRDLPRVYARLFRLCPGPDPETSPASGSRAPGVSLGLDRTTAHRSRPRTSLRMLDGRWRSDGRARTRTRRPGPAPSRDHRRRPHHHRSRLRHRHRAADRRRSPGARRVRRRS